ncbi:MAG: SIMPL domain-containing protein [Coleofasciculaceae cyanobacterium]
MNQILLPGDRKKRTAGCDRSRQWLSTISLLVGLLALTATNPAVAQEKLLRTLTVTGRGVELIPTTKAEVRLGVEVQGQTAQAVQQAVAQRSTAVVELLRARNVEQLETTGIRLNPIYRNQNDAPRTITGYSGSNIVRFRIPTEQAGRIVDDAVQAGATRIDRISFTASDEAISTAQKQALRKATQDAQQQADAVLSTLNLTRKDIVGIQINGATPLPPMTMFASENVFASSSVETPIVGSEQKVQASVTLQISY